jgi:hypothetical protein
VNEHVEPSIGALLDTYRANLAAEARDYAELTELLRQANANMEASIKALREARIALFGEL